MPRIESKVDRESDEFANNKLANEALAEQLRELSAEIRTGGSAHARERHLSRGKLLPRDRIDALTDDDTGMSNVK
jgi:3-methylcrotonyl-CoA carboxylase beta subunit